MTDSQIEDEIQGKGLTAPRVIPQRIQDVIASEHYFTGYHGALMSVWSEQWRNAQKFGCEPEGVPDSLKLLTFCVLVLKNGFTVTGESACASKENFNEEIGRKIARQNAVAKIWALEGYLLKERLSNNP